MLVMPVVNIKKRLVAMMFYALFAWVIIRLIKIVFTADTADS
ncbi:MAG: hypothetical protein UT61_C0024G0007 [Candidatus Woesebacteria bacterium GW2011_GWA1_39_8]|uniref:Uncharacterized protein n=1 Tax=Candidatus Woesebacteria bacterium GW2011_GWA1_39_8 TaxID=1618552 RepID=A0A0G0S4W1_9BACT|nr:MAG: hypothetical protein UT61_C0024G0007 [Candidatus Woesebacteria bacterium GW2011_GWA1_39_8]